MSYVNPPSNGGEPTLLGQWRQNRIQAMTLPSGNTIKLKRVGLLDLIAQGRIPDTLSGAAANLASKPNVSQMSIEDLKRFAVVVDLVVKASAVEPKIIDDSGTDEGLGVTEVDFVDKQAIFNWANGVANALRPFRASESVGAAAAA